jgi:hypothetical protein
MPPSPTNAPKQPYGESADLSLLKHLYDFLLMLAGGVAVASLWSILTDQDPVSLWWSLSLPLALAFYLLPWLRKRPPPRPRTWRGWVLMGVFILLVATVGYRLLPRPCDPILVRVATTPTMLGVYQELAQAFENSDGDCPRAEMYVYGLPSMADAIAALREDWGAGREGAGDGEAMTQAGPQPDLFLAESTAELNLIDHLTSGTPVTFDHRGSVASSPVVIAEPVAGGRPEPGEILWSELLETPPGSAQAERPQQANPTSSAVGLVSTAAMYQFGVLDGTALTPGRLRDPDRDFRHVHQAVGIGGEDQRAVLARFDTENPQARPRAGIVPEQGVLAWNEGRDCLDDVCLQAVYPPPVTDAAQLDYPAAVVDGAEWVSEDRQRLARDFTDFLQTDDDAQNLLADRGFRTPEGALTSQLTADSGVDAEWQVQVPTGPGYPHDGDTLDAVRLAWEKHRQPVRLVLAIDRSLSMATPSVAGTRMDEAKQAVEEFRQELLGPRDEITVWSYGEVGRTGPHHDPLVPLGIADGNQLMRIQAAVRELQVPRDPSEGSALYDTITEAVEELQVPPARDELDIPLDVVIVVTDGGDSGRGASKDELGELLVQQDSAVYALAFGDASCQDLGPLAGLTGGSCQDAGVSNLDPALRQLAWSFWSTLP